MIYGPPHFYEDQRLQEIHDRKRRYKETWAKLKSRLKDTQHKPDDERPLLKYLPRYLHKHSLAEVLRAVSTVTSVSKKVILGDSRVKESVIARKIFVWVAHEVTGQSMAAICRYCGNRHHASGIHLYRCVEAFPLDFENLIALTCTELAEMRA